MDGFIPKPRPTNAFKAKASLRKQAAKPDQAMPVLPWSTPAQAPVKASHSKDTHPASVTSVQAVASSSADALPIGTGSSDKARCSCTAGNPAEEEQHDRAQQPQKSPASQQPVAQPDASSQPPLDLEALPAGVPVISFEIDDAEGPLEGAANDLSSQFGRLKVSDCLRESPLGCRH